MIRLAMQILLKEDRDRICASCGRMLKALGVQYTMERFDGRWTLTERIHRNPFYYDLLILDTSSPDYPRSIELLSQAKADPILVLMCEKEIRPHMLYRPSAYYRDADDFNDYAGQMYELFEKLKEARQQFCFRSEREFISLTYNQLVMFERSERSVALYTIQRTTPFMLSSSLDQIMERLPEEDFIHCHQSLIVHLRYVERVNTERQSFVMRNGRYADISRRNYRRAVQAYEAYLDRNKHLF